MTAMKRLPFRLPEWAPRTTWASEEAKAVWESRINRVSQAWIQTERDLVVENVKPSALQNISPEELPELLKREALRGSLVLPLQQVAKTNGYLSASIPLQSGASFDYRVAITNHKYAADWSKAWGASDNETIGKLLGYPDCCRKFFERVWVKERWFDTTWPMAHSQDNFAEVPEGIGILWRWHGVRTISHLPCSFSCSESKTITENTLAVMEGRFPEEASWLKEITSWPVKWTALHGIAEITTPINRTSVATDATAGKLTIHYTGKGYPVEGAIGTGFPHRQNKPMNFMRLSNSKDNGFVSHAAMQEAHGKLLSLIKPPYKTVLDLGCGDGVLLSKIPAARRIGVEIDARVAKLAERRVDRVIVGDVKDRELVSSIIAAEAPDLIIAQRDRNPAATLNAPNVLSYTYEGGAEGTLYTGS